MLSVLWSGAAWANPISMEVLRVRQLPSTTHVQLTWGVDGSTADTPLSSKRDGSEIQLAWTSMSGFTANTGSGLVKLSATQACDCDVAVGQHKYILKVKSAMGGKEMDYEGSITVEQGLTVPPDAGAPVGDLNPWEIPEPSQLQGLNCSSTCSTVVPNPDAGATVDAGSTKPNEDDGGCSVSGRGRAASAGLLLLLCLGLVAIRRR